MNLENSMIVSGPPYEPDDPRASRPEPNECDAIAELTESDEYVTVQVPYTTLQAWRGAKLMTCNGEAYVTLPIEVLEYIDEALDTAEEDKLEELRNRS